MHRPGERQEPRRRLEISGDLVVCRQTITGRLRLNRRDPPPDVLTAFEACPAGLLDTDVDLLFDAGRVDRTGGLQHSAIRTTKRHRQSRNHWLPMTKFSNTGIA